jgi:hypothetical protein
MPAAAADAGSNASLASTSAQTSPRCVARASAKSSTLVLPDEAVPQISVRQPRARPPVSKSSCGIPLETISGDGRTSRRAAGTTAVSFEIAPTWAKSSAVFFATFSAVEHGEDGGEKIKGRPVAADKKTEEADILFSQLSGNAEGGISPGEFAIFAFYSPMKVSLRGPPLSRRFRANHQPELQLEDLQCFAADPAIPNRQRAHCAAKALRALLDRARPRDLMISVIGMPSLIFGLMQRIEVWIAAVM